MIDEKRTLLEKENKEILLSEAVDSNYDLDRVDALSKKHQYFAGDKSSKIW